MKIGAAFGAQPFTKVAQRAPQGGFKGQRTADGIYLSGTGVDKNADTLPDALKEKIREQAKKDVRTGEYMSKDFVSFRQGYLQKNISPNRTGAMSQVSSFLGRISASNRQGSILDLFGMPYSAKIQKGLTKTTASIFNQNGEMIAGYHSDSGWQSVPTQAEDQYWTETAQVYADAWDAAKQELQGQQGGGTFDVLA